MTITSTTLYWILMLDGISNMSIVGIVVSAIVLIGLCFYIIAMMDCGEKINKYIFIWVLIQPFIIFAMIALFVFIPTTKQMATILIAPKLINSNFVQEDLPKEAKELYSMAKSYLKEQITETNKDKKQ